MEYSTFMQRDTFKKSYCLKIFVPVKNILQVLRFVSGLNTDSEIITSGLSIIAYNEDKNILQYINYELDKFISNIESIERCYSEIFMEVKA